MRIKTEKGDECPVCRRLIKSPNFWVRFHVRYTAHPIVILACKNCNWIEMLLRTGEIPPVQRSSFFYRNPYRPNRRTRSEEVVDFMKKFDISLD